MLKVLLVEDEQYIAQGLSMLIDWESCGYEIAGTAYNGQEAVEFLQDTPVDLILSDIKMPVMGDTEHQGDVSAHMRGDPLRRVAKEFRRFRSHRIDADHPFPALAQTVEPRNTLFVGSVPGDF